VNISLHLSITLLEHARRDGQGSVLGGDFLLQCGHVADEGDPSTKPIFFVELDRLADGADWRVPRFEDWDLR
jgi:hypothetical protein